MACCCWSWNCVADFCIWDLCGCCNLLLFSILIFRASQWIVPKLSMYTLWRSYAYFSTDFSCFLSSWMTLFDVELFCDCVYKVAILSLKKRSWGAPGQEATRPVPQMTPSTANPKHSKFQGAMRGAHHTCLNRGEGAMLSSLLSSLQWLREIFEHLIVKSQNFLQIRTYPINNWQISSISLHLIASNRFVFSPNFQNPHF